MRLPAPLALCLALAACSAPVGGDAGPDAPPAVDAAGDVAADTAADVQGEDVECLVCAAGCMVQTGGGCCLECSAPDAGAPDARDAGGSDVTADVVAMDAPGDVVADAPPARPNLATMYPDNTAEIAFRATCAATGCAPYDVTRAQTSPAPSCSIAPTDVMTFTLRACTPDGARCADVNGTYSIATAAATVFVHYDGTGVSRRATTVRGEHGAAYGAEAGVFARNFHLQFSATATASESGMSGIPGTTVAADLGDAWLLGCPQR